MTDAGLAAPDSAEETDSQSPTDFDQLDVEELYGNQATIESLRVLEELDVDALRVAMPGRVQATLDDVAASVEDGGKVLLDANQEYHFSDIYVPENVILDYNGAVNEIVEPEQGVLLGDGAQLVQPRNEVDRDLDYSETAVINFDANQVDSYSGNRPARVIGGWTRGNYFDPSGIGIKLHADDRTYTGSASRPRIEFIEVRSHGIARCETGIRLECWNEDPDADDAAYVNSNTFNSVHVRRCERCVEMLGTEGASVNNQVFDVHAQPSTPDEDDDRDFPGTDVVWHQAVGQRNKWTGVIWDLWATHNGVWRLTETAGSENWIEASSSSVVDESRIDRHEPEPTNVASYPPYANQKYERLLGEERIGSTESIDLTFTVPNWNFYEAIRLEVRSYRDHESGANNPLTLSIEDVPAGSYHYALENHALNGEFRADQEAFTLIEPTTNRSGDRHTGTWWLKPTDSKAGGSIGIHGQGASQLRIEGKHLRKGTADSEMAATEAGSIDLTLSASGASSDAGLSGGFAVFLERDRRVIDDLTDGAASFPEHTR